MKRSIAFYIVNALLVLAVGLIIGLTFSSYIFSGTAGIVAFSFLLVTLALPSVLFALNSKLITGDRIIISLFIIAEFILNVTFLFIPEAAFWIYAVIQAALIVVLLVSILIILSLFKKDESKEGE